MNLNTIKYTETLTVDTYTEQPIRAFAEQANTIEIYAPVSQYDTAFIIYQGLKNGVINPKLRATERLLMTDLTSDLTGYNKWQSVIPGTVLNDMSQMESTGVRVLVEFWFFSGNAIGVAKVDSDVTATIQTYLETNFPNATDGQYVRVLDTDTDWYYDLDTTTWIDYQAKYLIGIKKEPTSSLDFTLERGIYTGDPSIAPDSTEIIIQTQTGNSNDIADNASDIADNASDIADILDGTQIADKATKDASGNVITTTYATKAELQTTDDIADQNTADIVLLQDANFVKTVTYAVATGILTFTHYDATTTTIDLPMELIVSSGSYDDATNELVLVLASGGEIRIPVSNLLSDIDATGVRFDGSATNYLTAKTSVQTGMVELDVQVKANADAVIAEATARQTADAVINLKNAEQDKAIAEIQEFTRKAVSGDTKASETGSDIIILGQDVANGGVTVKLEGETLDSENKFNLTTTTTNGVTATVSGNQVTLSGTATAETTFTLVTGLTATNKAYVNQNYISGTSTGVITLKNGATALNAVYGTDYSGVVTLEGTTLTLVIASGAVLTAIIYKININDTTTDIANKQFSPLYNDTFDNLTDTQIKAQMDYWINNGTLPNSIMSESFDKKITSVGKNVLDQSASNYNNASAGQTYNYDGNKWNIKIIADDLYKYFTFKVDVKPNTAYSLSQTITEISGTWLSTGLRIFGTAFVEGQNIGIANEGYIDTLALTTDTFNSGDNNYIWICYYPYSIGEYTLEDIQLEEGSTATAYAPYVHNELYIEGDTQGYSVAGVKDSVEFRDGKPYYVQRVQKYTLQASDIQGFNNGFTNIILMTVPKTVISDIVDNDVADTDGFNIRTTRTTPRGSVVQDSVDNQWKHWFRQDLDTLYITSPNGEYANITEAQADLAGTVIYYELATPIETLITADGNLQAYPNGSYYFENAKYEVLQYSSGLTTSKDISSVIECVKINADGSQTVIDVADITLASNQVSAISGAVDGEFYYIEYYFTGTYVQGLKTITYYEAIEDLRFPITTTKLGATSKPDFDYTNIALLFPQNDTTEIAYYIAQIPHQRVTDSPIWPHVHCRLTGAGQPVMKMDYKWYNPEGEAVPSSWTTYTMNVNEATWSSGTISNMIYGSEAISGVGKDDSSILLIKLYRDDNVYSGDLLVDEFDIHYYVTK